MIQSSILLGKCSKFSINERVLRTFQNQQVEKQNASHRKQRKQAHNTTTALKFFKHINAKLLFNDQERWYSELKEGHAANDEKKNNTSAQTTRKAQALNESQLAGDVKDSKQRFYKYLRYKRKTKESTSPSLTT